MKDTKKEAYLQMWKQKLGISIPTQTKEPIQTVLNWVSAAGFDAVSPEWTRGNLLAETVQYARSIGLYVQSLHAPFGKSADLWSEDRGRSTAAVEELSEAVRDCAALEIPILVCHAWIGFEYRQTPNEVGLRHYQTIVELAATLGVKIAFENTEGQEFLFALMRHFKGNPTVGFCWDSGHEMCYNHSEDLLAEFGDVLLMTHLNDNLGISRFDGKTFWTDDLHLLPFDGIADWRSNAERLRRCPPLEYLNFELVPISKPNRHENDGYAALPLEVYFAEAYKRACRVASLYLRQP